MGALSALSDALGVLKRNPILFVPVFALTLIGAVLGNVQFLFPEWIRTFVSLPIGFVNAVVVAPFFLGGIYAMANRGLVGRTDMDEFLPAAKGNFVRFAITRFLFSALVFVVVLVLAIAFVVVTVFVVGFGVAGGSPDVAMGSFVLVGVLGLVIALLGAIPGFFLQFYGAAVVVSDADIVDAFRRSVGLVWNNLLSTLGYNVVVVLVSLLSAIPFLAIFAASGVFSPEQFQAQAQTGRTVDPFAALSPAMWAVYLIGTVVVGTVVGTFVHAYHVAYYVDRTA